MPARVHGGTRAPVQPLGATGADADLGVVPEASQILLGERRPAAPADRALNLVVRNRRSHHVCILPPEAPIREHRRQRAHFRAIIGKLEAMKQALTRRRAAGGP